jgi:hypothetical protein
VGIRGGAALPCPTEPSAPVSSHNYVPMLARRPIIWYYMVFNSLRDRIFSFIDEKVKYTTNNLWG